MAGKRRERPADGEPAGAVLRQAVAELPSGYAPFLEELKTRIRATQIKAALSANRELVTLYWHIGRSIVQRQHNEGWGKAVVERLSADLQREFPGGASFSANNIWRMRAFYLAWAEPSLSQPAPDSGDAILAQAAQDPPRPIPAQPVQESGEAILAQPAQELGSQEVPGAAAEIPWFHNVVLFQKVKDPAQRLWYARQTVANGWSRSMLVHWIESDLYARQGQAVTNFAATLPAPQSDLAQQVIKDPYVFDFLTLRTDAAERDLERGLVEQIRKFLLEMGAGFAFVGQQVPLEVDGEEFHLDLLFYHLRLRCFVVIDLKAGGFQPEHAGKMNHVYNTLSDNVLCNQQVAWQGDRRVRPARPGQAGRRGALHHAAGGGAAGGAAGHAAHHRADRGGTGGAGRRGVMADAGHRSAGAVRRGRAGANPPR